MYGTHIASTGSGAALAYTGMNVGAGVLTALGLLLVGMALLALVRKSPAVRP